MKVHRLSVYGVAERICPTIFTGFIVRSILYRASEGELKRALRRMHEERKPSEIYCTPFMEVHNDKIMLYGRRGKFLFEIFSFSWELADFIKGLFNESNSKGIIECKDYKVEILEAENNKESLNQKDVSRRIKIDFISPTTFRLPPIKMGSTTYFPFPRPDLLLKSMKRTYRINFGKTIDINTRSLQIVDVVWSRSYTLRDFRNRPYVCFRGSFIFEIKDCCKKALKQLLPLAEISGVGAWRFAGFGRVKFYESSNRRKEA